MNTVMPAKVVEVNRLYVRFLHKLVRMGYDEETIVKGVVLGEETTRIKVQRVIASKEAIDELGYSSVGGRPRIHPPKPTYSERVVAKAIPLRIRDESIPNPTSAPKKGRRSMTSMVNNERADIE